MLFILAANIFDLLLPIELFGSLSVMVTVLTLFRLRMCRGSCSCSSGGASPFNPKLVGFVGLVDKEPDVARGIMIDTGASINIHSKAWYERFVDTVLRPWNLWSNEFSVRGSRITGVEGGTVGTDKGHVVPGNVCGVSRKTGKTVDIPLTFFQPTS